MQSPHARTQTLDLCSLCTIYTACIVSEQLYEQSLTVSTTAVRYQCNQAMKLLAVEVLADGGRFISDMLDIVDNMLHIQSTDNIRYTHSYVLVYFMHCVVKI
jgi:uncharacterized membrane protein YgdD (TMEM256/DUF423 family)